MNIPAINITAEPVFQRQDGLRRFQGTVTVGPKFGARVVVDIGKPGQIQPASMVRAVADPSAVDVGLGPERVAELAGLSVRELQQRLQHPSGQIVLEPVRFARILADTAVIGATMALAALPGVGRVAAPAYAAARIARLVEEAPEYRDVNVASIPAEAFAEAITSALTSSGVRIVVTPADVRRALLAHRAVRRDDAATKAQVLSLRAKSYQLGSQQHQEALALLFADLLFRGLELSEEWAALAGEPRVQVIPTPTITQRAPVARTEGHVGCACQLKKI